MPRQSGAQHYKWSRPSWTNCNTFKVLRFPEGLQLTGRANKAPYIFDAHCLFALEETTGCIINNLTILTIIVGNAVLCRVVEKEL